MLSEHWKSFIYPFGAAVLSLFIWHESVRLSGSEIFPSPHEVVLGAVDLFSRGLMVSYILDSMRRVIIGYLLAVATGIPMGLALGWFPTLNAMVNPVAQMLRPISPLAWAPLAIVWFGVSDLAPIFLIFLAAFFTIVLSVTAGVRDVPFMYWQAGRNFGLSSAGLLFRVLLPATLPRMIVGLRVALGVAWIVVVAAEMIAVNSGLGYLIIDSRNAGKRYDLVIAGMLLIGLIGLALDVSFRYVERLQTLSWGFRVE